MVREIGPYEFWIGTVSHDRAERVGPQEELTGRTTWYVVEGEGSEYAAAGATVMETAKGLPAARNQILDDAQQYGLPVVMLSDDLESVSKLVRVGDRQLAPMTVEEAVLELYTRLRETEYKLAGAAQNLNPYWTSRRTSTHLTISGDLFVIRPNPLRFHPDYFTAEDTEYVLQHMETYGGAVRCDDIYAVFRHYQAGGCTDVRDEQTVELRYRQLRKRYGKNVVKNSKGRVNIVWRSA